MLRKTDLFELVRVSRVLQLLKNVTNKGFFHLLLANVTIGLLAFGGQLLVAKFLTPVDLGRIKIMQSFIGVGAILAGFGFNTAVLKLCSEKRPFEEQAFLFRKNSLYTALPTLILLVGLFVLAKLGILCPDAVVNNWLPIYMLAIPAMTYTSLIMAYLQALKKIQLMAKLQVAIRVLSFIALTIMTYFYGFVGFVLAAVLAGCIAALPLAYLVKDDLKIKARVQGAFSQSFFYAKWSVSANAVSTIGQYMDIFMLNYLITDRASMGYYGLSTIFILGMSYVSLTAQSIATPYFSEKGGDKKEFLRVLWKYQVLMVLLGAFVSIVAFAAVPMFISIVYGSDYAPAGVYFRVLVLKYFFWNCCALLGGALVGLGKMKYNFVSVAISVPTSLVLSYFAISSYGVIGAAIAQAATYLITLALVSLMAIHAIRMHFEIQERTPD